MLARRHFTAARHVRAQVGIRYSKNVQPSHSPSASPTIIAIEQWIPLFVLAMHQFASL
jgi:hypothetical protein